MANAQPQSTVARIDVARMLPFADARVGVIGVVSPPLRAHFIVAATALGIPWESSQSAEPGQEVLGSGTIFHVTMIAPDVGSAPGDRGGISVELSNIASPWPKTAVVLAADGPAPNEDGHLRVDGPSVQTATDAHVKTWIPDQRHPTAVLVEWFPAKWGRAYSDADEIKSARLTVGTTVTFGTASAKVLAIQGASAEHPARVILDLLPRAPR